MMYYFSDESRRLRYGDDREIALGVTHKVEGPVVMCMNGLHWSRRLVDALGYAPGPILWIVEPGGQRVEDHRKGASEERTYMRGGINVTEPIYQWAVGCVQEAHDILVERLVGNPPYVYTAFQERESRAWWLNAEIRRLREVAAFSLGNHYFVRSVESADGRLVRHGEASLFSLWSRRLEAQIDAYLYANEKCLEP